MDSWSRQLLQNPPSIATLHRAARTHFSSLNSPLVTMEKSWVSAQPLAQSTKGKSPQALLLNMPVIKGKQPTVLSGKGRESIPKHRDRGSSGRGTVWDKGDGSCWHGCDKAGQTQSCAPVGSEMQSVKRAGRKERQEKRGQGGRDSPRVEGSRNNNGENREGR